MGPDFAVAWDIQRPADIEQALRARLDRAGDRRWELLTQIARAQGLRGDFAAAHETLDRAEEGSEDPATGVRCLLERGRLFFASGHPDRARPHVEHALAGAQAHRLEGHAVDAAALLGALARGEEVLAWRERAVAMAEASPSAAHLLGAVYCDLGAALLDAGRPGPALAAFERALAWWAGRDRSDRIAGATVGVARALRALGRHREALKALRRIAADGGGQDSRVHEEIGENLLAAGRAAAAAGAFARAYALLAADADAAMADPRRLEYLRARAATG